MNKVKFGFPYNPPISVRCVDRVEEHGLVFLLMRLLGSREPASRRGISWVFGSIRHHCNWVRDVIILIQLP